MEITNLFSSRLFRIYFFILFFTKKAIANKYCAFEFDGEPKYYICQRNEHCCSIGCCVNLAFHFYQLYRYWYYWLLVIFMFMVCSGGGWWSRRFCRNPASTVSRSSYPSSTTHSLGPSSAAVGHHRHESCHASPHYHHQQSASRAARTSRVNPRRQSSTYYLQRIWKNPNMIPQQSLPPSYSTMFLNLNSRNGRGPVDPSDVSTTASSGDQPSHRSCPYQQLYHLYGPPPSYDSVIQVTANGTSCLILEPISSEAVARCDDETHRLVTSNCVQEEADSSSISFPEDVQISSTRATQLITTPLGGCAEGELEGGVVAVTPSLPIVNIRTSNSLNEVEGHMSGLERNPAADNSSQK